MNAVIYLRVSTREQAEGGVSLAVQEERALGYCTAQGLNVVEIIADKGVSAGKALENRRGGAKLLRRLKRGAARHVVAFKLDRLFRSARDALEVTEQWEKAGVSLHLVDLGGGQSLNTGTAVGKMLFTMMAAFAEMERTLVRERTRAALGKLRQDGKRISRHIPYGYELAKDGESLKKIPREQRAIELMKRMRAEGKPYRAIAEKLTQRGYPPKRGKEWGPMTVRNILLRQEKLGAPVNGD